MIDQGGIERFSAGFRAHVCIDSLVGARREEASTGIQGQRSKVIATP